MMSVEEAIVGRQSIRAFLDKPVPRNLVEKILRIAARAPSGSNIQPWKVYVATGEAKARMCAEMYDRYMSGDDGTYCYPYYSGNWREPYLTRRRRCGFGLYDSLGIAKGDKAAYRRQTARNYLFFDAPVGMIFTIDRDRAQGAWVDYGMFLQSVMIAARPLGLETCPAAAFCTYADTIARHLGIPDEQIVVCGMALGYQDPGAPENKFRTERMELEEFVKFVE